MNSVSELLTTELKQEYSAAGLVVLAKAPEFLRLECSETEKLVGVMLATKVACSSIRVVFFVVSEEYRNQGLGHQAWDLMIEWGRQRSLREVVVEVRCSNAKAIKFYTRVGLSLDVRLPEYYGSEDGLRMCARID